jgi:hypothetical protein
MVTRGGASEGAFSRWWVIVGSASAQALVGSTIIRRFFEKKYDRI